MRRPPGLRLGLGVADADEQAIRPALEACGLAKAWQVAPDVEERLLDRVLCEMRVAQDAHRDRLQAGVALQGERFERPLVAFLCCRHEIAVHALGPCESPIDRISGGKLSPTQTTGRLREAQVPNWADREVRPGRPEGYATSAYQASGSSLRRS